MLWSVFHEFDARPCANRYEILLCDLLLEVVLSHDSKEASLDLLESVAENEEVIVMEVELFLLRSDFLRLIKAACPVFL